MVALAHPSSDSRAGDPTSAPLLVTGTGPSGSVSATSPTIAPDSWRALNCNQQYSIVALTDSTGAVAERYSYTAYGEPKFLNASGTVLSTSSYADRYTYTGREWDDTLKVYHYRARLFNAMAAKFLKDPIGFYGGQWALTCYVKNNPLNSVDLSGLQIMQEEPDRKDPQFGDLYPLRLFPQIRSIPPDPVEKPNGSGDCLLIMLNEKRRCAIFETNCNGFCTCFWNRRGCYRDCLTLGKCCNLTADFSYASCQYSNGKISESQFRSKTDKIINEMKNLNCDSLIVSTPCGDEAGPIPIPSNKPVPGIEPPPGFDPKPYWNDPDYKNQPIIDISR